MKKNLTELVFILDRSGSMAGLESDTIGGFNSMLEKQKKLEGEAVLTTVLFDDKYEVLHDRISLNAAAPITDNDYFVRGSTALLDAVGLSILKTEKNCRHTSAEFLPDKVMFIITTDGMENASTEFTYEKIHKMITEKKEKENWEFIFMGANIDAVQTAQSFGIPESRAVKFRSDKKGTSLNYEVMSELASAFRDGEEISEDWKKRIDEDMKNR